MTLVRFDDLTLDGDLTVPDGQITVGDSAATTGRIEAVGLEAAAILTKHTADTASECYLAAYSPFAGPTSVAKIGVVAFLVADTNATTGYASVNAHATELVAGAGVDRYGWCFWAGHGMEVFPADIAAAFAPGDKKFKVSGYQLISQGSIGSGTNNPALELNATWNNAATAFTGFKVNITDTTSDAASLLAVLQVGGTTKWRADKSGNVQQTGSLRLPNNTALLGLNAAVSTAYELIKLNASDRVVISPDGQDIVWGKANVALGGGSSATLGTVGGSGPATATQNSWVPMRKSDGTAGFVPFWV